MKQEKIQSPTKAIQNDRDFWVDVHNSALMIELGIHPRMETPRDSSVWIKSKQEKKILRTLRCAYKGKMHMGCTLKKSTPVYAKLIIQLKKNKHFPHTTYSTICGMHQIGDVLSFFSRWDRQTKTSVNIVAKYSYNGKTYKPNELPYWY